MGYEHSFSFSYSSTEYKILYYPVPTFQKELSLDLKPSGGKEPITGVQRTIFLSYSDR